MNEELNKLVLEANHCLYLLEKQALTNGDKKLVEIMQNALYLLEDSINN